MKLFTLALGAAGGYAVARALEAKAIGLPLNMAFRLDASFFKPVSVVQRLQGSVALTQQQQASAQPQIIDVTPVTPT